jgi:hypothetical protein
MRRAVPVFALLLACAPAAAQDTTEARLREMLRRTASDLRAAQDSQAAMQAKLDQETQINDTLRKQVDALTARAAEPAKPPISDAEIARMQADLREAQARAAALEAGLKEWQDAYRSAADLARAKDLESKTFLSRAGDSDRQASICAAANAKLIGVANDILHLYRSQSFRSLLLGSYEPVLGLKKVELENTIQDYEDKISDRKFRGVRGATNIDAPK